MSGLHTHNSEHTSSLLSISSSRNSNSSLVMCQASCCTAAHPYVLAACSNEAAGKLSAIDLNVEAPHICLDVFDLHRSEVVTI